MSLQVKRRQPAFVVTLELRLVKIIGEYCLRITRPHPLQRTRFATPLDEL
jgi:hypothetical protein